MKKELLNMLSSACRDRPVTREDIRGRFRISDRTARGLIEDLRDDGYPVIGTSDSKGYWIARSDAELNAFMRNYTAKAVTIQKRAYKMASRFYQVEVRGHDRAAGGDGIGSSETTKD